MVARVRPSTRGCVCVFKRVRLFARVCCGAAVLERVRLFVRVYLLLRGCVSACKDVLLSPGQARIPMLRGPRLTRGAGPPSSTLPF